MIIAFKAGQYPHKCQVDLFKKWLLATIIDFNISVIYMAKCATSVDHCSETECETSGNDAPCKTFIMRGNYGGRLASCYINGFHWVFMINYFDILHGNICQEDKPCSIYCRGLLGLGGCTNVTSI